jgi:hypothetical protein
MRPGVCQQHLPQVAFRKIGTDGVRVVAIQVPAQRIFSDVAADGV